MVAWLPGHLRRNVIAYIALVFAVSGTSFAAARSLLPANSVGTRQVINHSLLKKDFKRGQLPRGPRGLRGDIGPAGATGPAGPRGPQGLQGLLGLPGTARAYGRVSPIGAVSRSKNVVGATEPFGGAGGVYCIQLAAGFDANMTGLVATPDFSGDVTDTGPNTFQSFVEWDADAPDCPTGQLEVDTFVRIPDTTGSADGDLRTEPIQFNNAAFFFVVP